MLSEFLTVCRQVAVLGLLIAVGYGAKKRGMMEKQVIKGLSDITLYIAIPCLLIRAFNVEYDDSTFSSFFLEILAAVICHLLSLLAALAAFRKLPDKKRRILTCALVFGNCGFMGFPLLIALFGPMGLFYGSAFNVILNIGMWGFGVNYLNKDAGKKSLLDFLKMPPIISVAIGILVFIFRINIPSVLDKSMEYLGNLAVPLPLMVIGAQLTDVRFSQLAKDRDMWVLTVLRLIAVPFASALLFRLIGIDGLVGEVAVISVATPTASILGMIMADSDAQAGEKTSGMSYGAYTSAVVSIVTILSMLTIPVAATFAALMLR